MAERQRGIDRMHRTPPAGAGAGALHSAIAGSPLECIGSGTGRPRREGFRRPKLRRRWLPGGAVVGLGCLVAELKFRRGLPDLCPPAARATAGYAGLREPDGPEAYWPAMPPHCECRATADPTRAIAARGPDRDADSSRALPQLGLRSRGDYLVKYQSSGFMRPNALAAYPPSVFAIRVPAPLL